jgi:hypothetical protein
VWRRVRALGFQDPFDDRADPVEHRGEVGEVGEERRVLLQRQAGADGDPQATPADRHKEVGTS